MGFFSRKPGGTFFGNLVRGFAKNASGGLLGGGGMMISQQDYDSKNQNKNFSPAILSDAAKQQIGAAALAAATAVSPSAGLSLVGTGVANSVAPYSLGAVKSAAEKYGMMAAAFAAIGTIFYLIIKKK